MRQTVLRRLTVVVAAAGAAAAVLPPSPDRASLTAACLTAGAALVAASTGWRWSGTLAAGLLPLVVAAGEVVGGEAAPPARLVLGAALLLVLLNALDAAEQDVPTGAAPVRVRPPLRRRLGPPAAALGAAVLIAVITGRDVVPSVGLVVVGLVAAVGALALATHEHRAARPPT